MAGPASPDVRVLLVDDQPQFRRAAAMLIQATDGLALAGEAGSGEEAVVLARELTAGPGADGRQAAGHQRTRTRPGGSWPRTPRTRVILVSTYEAADLPDLDTCGAIGFLRKQDLDAGALLA